MDAFVTTQKKRKLSSLPPAQPSPTGEKSSERTPVQRPGSPVAEARVDTDEESTEIKLALLASLLGDDDRKGADQDILLDALLAHDGSVSAAAEALQNQPERWSKKRKTKLARGTGAIGHQTSLRALFPASAAHPSSPEKGAGTAALLSRRGRTLFLYDPADVEAHTPCTLVHNFLPAEMANDLLREMLAESETFGTPHFKLFDQVVSSPHTSCFYLESAAEAAAATNAASLESTSGDRSTPFRLTAENHEGYRYNGARLSDVRTTTPQLARVRPLVQAAVNAAIQKRITTHYPGGRKLPHQHPGPWQPNAAFVNCYDGAQQSVGWHSDQMTYLGPRAVIGSLSLGVAREFRVRRIVPRDGGNEDDDAAGQISIHLPHNSLLVMHAEMQEEWKHSVSPATSIDPHPLAGNKRINVTYRDYRPEFHPNKTPRCYCGIATVLRVVQRKKENHGRYFWMCHAGNIPDKEGCNFFQWAEFDDDGNPIWRHKNKLVQ